VKGKTAGGNAAIFGVVLRAGSSRSEKFSRSRIRLSILRKSFPLPQKLTAGNGAGSHEKRHPYMIYHAAEKKPPSALSARSLFIP
jgi:hypothetical protein